MTWTLLALVAALACRSASGFSPHTTPSLGPEEDRACEEDRGFRTFFIMPRELGAVWDESLTVCQSLRCDGSTRTSRLEFEVTCEEGCVDTAASMSKGSCTCDPHCHSQVDVCDGYCDHGTCSPDNGLTSGARCHCDPGYEGLTCQYPICASFTSPCTSHGTCVMDPTASTGYHCQCQEGYTGEACGTEIVSMCSSKDSPCSSHGTCTDDSTSSQGFSCHCERGYSGETCDVKMDPTCPNGWTLLGGSICYINAYARQTYSEAQHLCKILGGVVGEAKTQEELDQFMDIRNSISVNKRGGNYWLGLQSDCGGDGQWRWQTGQELTFTAWKDGQPGSSPDKCCVTVDGAAEWRIVLCTAKRKYFCTRDVDYEMPSMFEWSVSR